MGARRGGRGHQAEEKEGLIDDLRACLLRRRWRGEEVEAGDGYFQCGQIVHIADEDPKMTELGVLDPPHVLPLMDFVRHLRAQGLSVPSVDPKDGGIFARALFLQVTPGPKAVGTQFVSQDNPDWTARNMKRTLGEAGFLRSDVVLWNVVPYCISTIDRNKNPTVAQIIEAIPYTQAFIDELKSLSVCPGRN
jgi:uracil-DNA glycosylase